MTFVDLEKQLYLTRYNIIAHSVTNDYRTTIEVNYDSLGLSSYVFRCLHELRRYSTRVQGIVVVNGIITIKVDYTIT